MQKLTLIAALALDIAGSSALACDWNKEAKTETPARRPPNGRRQRNVSRMA